MSERGRDPIGYDAEVFERLLRDPMDARPLAEKPGIDPGDARAALSICGLSGNYGAKGEPLACAYPRGHDGDHAWASLPTFVDASLAATPPADERLAALREAAQVILDRCIDFFGEDDLDPESSEAMPVVIKNRDVYALRAALAQSAPEAGGEDGR